MFNTGWLFFLSKLEIVAVMIFGAFSAITGKLRKLAAGLFIFEVVVNLGMTLLGVIFTRTIVGSWKETWKSLKDDLDKPYGPQDYSEYENAILEKDCEIKALKEERKENFEKLKILYKKMKDLRKATEKNSELVDKYFGV